LCEQLEGKFILTGLQPEVESLIKVSLLDTILEIKENVDEATEVMEKDAE
jgi:anti-anti-sigma regulatory factor